MASEGRSPPPIVLYDANLLYPFHLRNLLVQLGVNGIVSSRWTDAIHDEWIRNLVAAGSATRERLLRTRDIMKRALPDADVRNYEHRIATLTLPDPGDRHVLAAAIESGAETILTFNVKHFPADVLAGVRLTTKEPDSFLCDLYDADPEAMLAVVDDARANLSRTAPSGPEFIAAIERQRLTAFATRLRPA